jgi:Spy/CpxP family protein refolding chaperone
MMKQSRSKRLVLVAAAVAVVVGATPVAYAGGQAVGAGLAGRPVARFVVEQIGRLLALRSEVDLTADQRLQLRSLFEQHREKIVGAARTVVAKRRALQDAVRAEKPDEKAIRSAADDLGQAIGDAAVLASTLRKDAHAVLTEKQAAAIEQFRAATRAAVDALLDELAGKK